MTSAEELEAAARAIIDENRYMTLGTADTNGRPWVSPVWYAPEAYREFFWVSYPDARHSRNVAARPEIAIVIFDSRAPVGSGQGVFMSAVAEQVADSELERGIGFFSRRSQLQGARAWRHADVQPPAALRLYCARVSEHFVLDTGDRRISVSLE
ncbi:MAG TPA: pyridoxamine 5'-phosphate oxidase family protein [Gaiellaceae bacterium]|nr:pyridoxamine 5'-phosphate oxidase family protein [Gaiellaceae bacterium]